MSQTIVHHLHKRVTKTPNLAALHFKDNEQWRTYTWAQVYEMVSAIGASLQHMGLQKNDRVALISETRPEWLINDFAIMGAGGVTVPIYPNNLPEEIAFILNNSEAKFLIVEDLEQFEKWKKIKTQCPTVKKVFIIDAKTESTGDNLWVNLISEGRGRAESFEKSLSEINLDTWATLLYTSGTTGLSKGVVLNHEQIMSEVEDIFAYVNVDHRDTSLAFLPFSHVLGRVEAWGSIYVGFSLGFAESIERLKDNFNDLKPTFIIAVPRIFEKLYGAIITQAQNNPLKRRIFDWAIGIGREYSRALQKRQMIMPTLAAQHALAKRLVFDKIINTLGGRIRLAASGGAPLNPDITEFFHAVGLLILEGYGLTETTAGITFNSPLHYKFGTVGRPLPEVEIKFADDGEILVKSKKCLKEYYKDPAANKASFDNGFFKTGDIGVLDEDGYLKITDRKKDLIKTAGGKYVAPQRLEGLLKTNPYVSNVLIHGDQKKYIVALLTLNELSIKSWAKANKLEYSNYNELTQTPEVYALVRDVVAQANTELASFESIKKFAVLPNDFTVESGEITPSLKVKRKIVDQRYAKEISELYGE
jgi:long-chain acyl-CoA synthetase